jgi:hypothetical protein
MTDDIACCIEPEDMKHLEWASRHLEHPSLAARISSLAGTPIDIAVQLLPRKAYRKIEKLAQRSISKALKVAISSLRNHDSRHSNAGLYQGMAAGSGAVGGLFGLYGLPFDLPVSTTLMLRSIAEIARSEGEDLSSTETQLACLEVFALGGHSESDDAAETGYYGIRLALGWTVTHAAHYIARHGLADGNAPILVSLIAVISSRFGAVVGQKTVAQLVPLVGAAGGAAINLTFMRHYQDMARGHFLIRRLERKYGKDIIKTTYENLCAQT